MKKKQIMSIVFLFSCFVLSANVFAQEKQEKEKINPFEVKYLFGKGPEIGTQVEDFSRKALDGTTFTLSEKRGKIVIFEFGACT